MGAPAGGMMRLRGCILAGLGAGLAVLWCLGCLGCTSAQTASGEWLTPQHDLAGTGLAPGPGPERLDRLVWKFYVGNAIWGGAVVTQERVFFGTQAGQLDTALVVTSSEDRLKDLLDWSEGIADVAIFTTLDELLADPFGRVWREIGQEKRVKLIDPVEKCVGKVLEMC